MVELKFYRDGDKVYLNMDNGITKEVDLSAITGGSGGGGDEGDENMVINFDPNTESLDKTWQDCYDAAERGINCYVLTKSDDPVPGLLLFYLEEVGYEDEYYVWFYPPAKPEHGMNFVADTPNGQLVLS